MVIEPLLIPMTGEELPESSDMSNHARADVSARGLWINGQTAFFIYCLFNVDLQYLQY